MARHCQRNPSCEWILTSFFHNYTQDSNSRAGAFVFVLARGRGQGELASLVSVVGGEAVSFTMVEVSPLVWVFGITMTSFLPFFFLLQGDKSNSNAAVWELEVYMRGKFFFSGYRKISVLTLFFFLLHPRAYGILVSATREWIPAPAVKHSLNHWTTGEVPGSWLLIVDLLPVEFYFHRWCALNIWNGLIRFKTNLKQGSPFLLPPLSYPPQKNSATANGWLPAYRLRLLLDYGKSLLHKEVKFCGQGDYAEIFSHVHLDLRKSIEVGWTAAVQWEMDKAAVV